MHLIQSSIMLIFRWAVQLLPSFLAFSLSAALNLTVYQPSVPFVPTPLPPPGAASHCDEIIQQFNDLGRTTVWDLVKKIHFEGNTGEPEVMVNLGEDRYVVSAGEYINSTSSYGNHVIISGTDRTTGAGFAHLIVYDARGKRIADATLTPPDDIDYHPGGIDYDGQQLWATLPQYRPNSMATFISVDPETLEKTVLLHTNDHYGGVVHDTVRKQLVTLNWGSRNASTWNLKAQPNRFPQFTFPKAITRNPSFYADYQDCKYLGHPHVYDYRAVMICSGVTSLGSNVTIGGLAIVDMATMVPLSEVPLTMTSDLGILVTMNPFDVDIVNGRLRAYFLPDQHNSTLYVYEPQVNSPYEF
jgi:hypothetical protein